MGALSVFLVAGEPSGDALGAALMAGLKTLVPDVRFDGIGGPLMQAEGLVSRFDMSELSVMGIAEVLPKYFHLKRRIAETAQAVVDKRPDVLITIDAPDFSFRVARRVKELSDVRTVHYVAPTVWAWRPGRAKKIAQFIDHVLALFPFEPPYMEAEGMACDFVGHPAATVPRASEAECAVCRAAHGLEAAEPLMLVLPGSRKGEVARMGPVFGAGAAAGGGGAGAGGRRSRGARDVVVIGSNVGKHISPFSSMYGSTKFAVNSLAEAARRELGPKGVRVTLVAPGIVRSEFQEVAEYDAETFGEFMDRIGPVLEPGDVARMVLYVVGQPAHVHVNDVTIRPTRQDYP